MNEPSIKERTLSEVVSNIVKHDLRKQPSPPVLFQQSSNPAVLQSLSNSYTSENSFISQNISQNDDGEFKDCLNIYNQINNYQKIKRGFKVIERKEEKFS